jgi:biopolymer transport protein ExbB
LLALTSVIGLTFIVERGLALRWRKVVPPEIEAAVESCQSPEDVPMLKRVCQQHTSPLSRLLLLAVDHLTRPKADNTDALQTRAGMKSSVWARTLSAGDHRRHAPLLGLVGTIVG